MTARIRRPPSRTAVRNGIRLRALLVLDKNVHERVVE